MQIHRHELYIRVQEFRDDSSGKVEHKQNKRLTTSGQQKFLPWGSRSFTVTGICFNFVAAKFKSGFRYF